MKKWNDWVSREEFPRLFAPSLGNCTISDDFISRCMWTADWHSTGADTSYRYDKQFAIRASDTNARAIAILKDNINTLNINGFNSSSVRHDRNSKPQVDIMIIVGSVYISGQPVRQWRLAPLLRANNLAPSMNKRGNCQDNAVAELFFSSLKK